jgi:TldD protein
MSQSRRKKVPLSDFFPGVKPSLEKIIRRLSGTFGYVSVLGTDVAGTRYTVRKDETSIVDSRWVERGFVLRLHNGMGYSEYSFNRLEDVETFVRHVEEWASASEKQMLDSGLSFRSFPVPREEELSGEWQGDVAVLPDELKTDEKVHRFRGMVEKAFRQSPLVMDVRVIYEEARVCKMFLSSARDLNQSYIWANGYVTILVRRDDSNRYTYTGVSGMMGPELIDQMEQTVVGTVTEAESLLDAERVKPGEYDVICGPQVAGVLAHEAFGHGVEMDMFVKNRARAAEYLGKPVASSLVTLRDGAAAARQVSSYYFDDEGVLGSDTTIIDRGIFRKGLADTLSAQYLGVPGTGNGKRESFERKAYARMTNTFFDAGSDSLEDMIASVKKGYLLEKISSGMEDPKNWGLQIIALFGREIINGRLTGKLVAPVVVSGYVPDVLGSISMVGRRVELMGTGMCGKGYKEYAKASDGGPHIKTRVTLV